MKKYHQAVNALITDNIDVWTSAIKKRNGVGRGGAASSLLKGKIELTGIKKLRELILELAVRGKLVPQEANDEPASILLEKIAKEKAQLIADKNLSNKKQKQKALPDITEEEKPFELPSGWEHVRLGNIGTIFNGNSVNAKLKEEKYTGLKNGLPFIATKDVDYGYKSLDYNNGVLIPADEPKFKIAHKNAVLVCAEGGSAGKKCGIADQDICFGNKLFANELYANLNSKFILYTYLSPTFYSQFSKSMTGIIGGISSNKFSGLVVSLPPLAEQHHIVAKVDELMLLCDQLEQQTEQSITAHKTLVEVLLAALIQSKNNTEFQQSWQQLNEHFDLLFTTDASIEQLKQTILQLAVMGKLVSFGENFYMAKVSQLIYFGPRNGFSPKEVGYETEIKVLKLGATTKGFLDLKQTKFVDVKIKQDSHLWMKINDILIQRGNSASYVGSNLLLDKSYSGYIYPDLMMKISSNEKVLPKYLSLSMSAPRSRKYFWSQMTGTSGTMPKISKKVVESLEIPVPPLPEQHRIVAKVDELMALCEQLKSHLTDAQTTQLHLADAVVSNALTEQTLKAQAIN